MDDLGSHSGLSMEFAGHALPMSLHGFVANAGPASLPGRLADADTHQAKKRRTNPPAADGLPSFSLGIGPVASQGNVGTWNTTELAVSSHALGDINITGVPAWPTAGAATVSLPHDYHSGSRFSVRSDEAFGFHQIALWSDGSGQGHSLPDKPKHEVHPQPTRIGACTTAAPAFALWDIASPSPVENCSSCYWFPSSSRPTLAGSQSPEAYIPANGEYTSLSSLSTPPFALGSSGYRPVDAALTTGNGELSHGHEPSLRQDIYQASPLLLDYTAPLGRSSAQKLHHPGHYFAADSTSEAHHSPVDLQQAALPNQPGVLTATEDTHLAPQYVSLPLPENGGDTAKEERPALDRWDGQRPSAVEVNAGSSSGNGVMEERRYSADSHGKLSESRKRRARFDENLRKETSNTRSMGACLRCHNQRVRCVPNKLDSKSPFAPCETCLNFRRDSKKTIHHLPCLRFRLTSVVLHRAGGLGLTRRFPHDEILDVDFADCPDKVIYDIEMTQGLCKVPMKLQVRRFKPRATDVLDRRYLDDGTPRKRRTAPFCLASMEKTAREFSQYIDRHAIAGLAEAAKDSSEIVKDTFAAIALHLQSLSAAATAKGAGTSAQAKRSPDQLGFLHKLVRLSFAIRHEMGSAWLCGEERLGMHPEFGPNVPLPGEVLVPRMIVAQFDSIRHVRIYKRLAPEVLRTFHTFLTSCNKEAWFTVFLGTFLLLHLVACASRDRYRHAKDNSEGRQLDTRYGDFGPLTTFVEDLHHGAVVLLAHWQYFKRCDLMNFNWDDPSDSALMCLNADQLSFLRRTVERLRDQRLIPTTPAEGCWEHELFWISRMFVSEASPESGWTPPEVFTRDKPSVGREVPCG